MLGPEVSKGMSTRAACPKEETAESSRAVSMAMRFIGSRLSFFAVLG
jgi:hypothetical protein